MFGATAIMIPNKIGLLFAGDFDVSRSIANALKVNPNIATLKLSARGSGGLDAGCR